MIALVLLAMILAMDLICRVSYEDGGFIGAPALGDGKQDMQALSDANANRTSMKIRKAFQGRSTYDGYNQGYDEGYGGGGGYENSAPLVSSNGGFLADIGAMRKD